MCAAPLQWLLCPSGKNRQGQTQETGGHKFIASPLPCLQMINLQHLYHLLTLVKSWGTHPGLGSKLHAKQVDFQKALPIN